MIGGIILAAGSSRRFGDDKRKQTLASGQSILEESIHKAASVLDKVLVVLRFGDREFAQQLSSRIDNDQVEYYIAQGRELGEDRHGDLCWGFAADGQANGRM